MYIKKDALNKRDKIVIGEYIAVSQFQDPYQLTWTNDSIPNDSLFSLFIAPFSNLQFDLRIDENLTNKLDEHNKIFKNGKSMWFHPHRIDTSEIKSIFTTYDNVITAIPVISIINQYATGSERFGSTLNLGVFLIKNNQIIYFNTCTFFDNCRSIITNMHIDYRDYKARPKHTQQQWDELVKNVMQPYIDRLK